MSRSGRTRRLLAPEVVQTSAMDCGPAALKSVLEGFGIPASYGRLREACQTDVDGTSIDTVEELARELGLDAEQVLVPPEHLADAGSDLLPAVLVTTLPSGSAHFVVAWRRSGRRVQVMDPAGGRRWPRADELVREGYRHALRVPAEAWRRWAGGAEARGALERRLLALVRSRGAARRLVDEALEDAGWYGVACLEAAGRLVRSAVRSGGLRRGREALRVLEDFFRRAHAEPPQRASVLPPALWPVQPADAEGRELVVRGLVLVRIRGRLAAAPSPAGDAEPAADGPLPSALADAIGRRERPPLRELVRLVRADGLLTPAVLLGAFALAGAAVLVQALLLRAALELGSQLGQAGARLAALAALLLFSLVLVGMELPIQAQLRRTGRRLETRLRLAFQRKIPRLSDRFFHSRPTSDMAERGHAVVGVRTLPDLVGQLCRAAFQLVLTTAAIAWLDPGVAPLAVAAAVASVALPLVASQKLLVERELSMRSQRGALARFYLDALLGAVPLRTHGAARAVRREHEGLLVEWLRSGLRLLRASTLIDASITLTGYGLAAWIVVAHLSAGGAAGGMLLLVYWALSLPALGESLAAVATQLPGLRNATLRVLEPLGAPDEHAARSASPAPADAEPAPRAPLEPDGPVPSALALSGTRLRAAGAAGVAGVRRPSGGAEPGAPGAAAGDRPPAGVALELRGVAVRAGGHAILHDVDLVIERGSHVAIVGPSGAGKSTLVGLLLGWHHPARGEVRVDGAPLDGAALAALRRATAWVDPSVQLWNRSLFDNLVYGARAGSTDAGDAAPLAIAEALAAADVEDVVESLPEGLQTHLGEGGARVAGGEGQRVRLARSLLRRDVRLALLDEPFRGLDAAQRARLLARAREHWRDATLLCVTHDVEETRDFERVLVVEDGRVVEDGAPTELARRVGSRYRARLEAERAARVRVWGDAGWRRLRLEDGRLVERVEPEDRA